MPYAPELGLRAFSFQWLSLFHMGTRQFIWSRPKPHCGSRAHAVAWLPENCAQELGIGTPGVAGGGGRLPLRLASCCLRAASSAALAWSAAAFAAASAAMRASAWAARWPALAR